ncbi:MAG: dephospho-CoA kinase, partial [Clostridiales bacterium]|nr:dephospho-CoA kinase [Clostridiales bacterium]
RRIEELAHSAEAAGDHVAVDAPTLFEAGADSICGMTVGILAPRRTRASRLAARDGNIRTEKQLRARLDASKPDSFYTDRCDITFRNDKGNDALEAFAEQISSGTYAKANKKGSAT